MKFQMFHEGFNSDITIYVNYQPEEPQILYPNDLAHPGCPESWEIASIIWHGREQINNISLDNLNECIDYVEEEIENLKNQDEEY